MTRGIPRRGFLASAAAFSAASAGCIDGLVSEDDLNETEDESGGDGKAELRESLRQAPSAGETEDWLSPQYDLGNTGSYPHSEGVEDDFEVLWEYEAGDGSLVSPVVSDGTVYTGDDGGNIYAVDVESGEELWAIDVNARVTDAISVRGDLLFVHGDAMYAVDRRDGDIVWRREDVGRAGLPVEDTLYTVGNRCHGVDAVTGEVRWTREIDTHENMYPAYARDRLYVASDGERSGSLYALDPDTGDELWSYYRGTHAGTPAAPPTYQEGTVYIHGNEHPATAVDPKDGELLWQWSPLLRDSEESPSKSIENPLRQPIDTATVQQSPCLHRDTMYINRLSTPITALDTETRDVEWTVEAGDIVTSTLVAAGDTLYTATDEQLKARDTETGETRATFPQGHSRPGINPALYQDTVLYPAEDATLYALTGG